MRTTCLKGMVASVYLQEDVHVLHLPRPLLPQMILRVIRIAR
ncbi:hypothetical protein OESDEN_15619 [Oesophagostomum dentatum]|uniref:Uncharacterized protein n=1 Tax=Oesophagostomum dentatum TaxID=61180 RepID=A0A0B1SNC8_OESDE|nr:hypothetical protein OESDEN_15619 [Oesophagostomum dentatum]